MCFILCICRCMCVLYVDTYEYICVYASCALCFCVLCFCVCVCCVLLVLYDAPSSLTPPLPSPSFHYIAVRVSVPQPPTSSHPWVPYSSNSPPKPIPPSPPPPPLLREGIDAHSPRYLTTRMRPWDSRAAPHKQSDREGGRVKGARCE